MAERALTFAEHIQELRRRLMWSLLFVAIGAGIGYALHNSLLLALQQPLHETLYYTTPTGAFSFIIKICTVFGFIVALPALLYHAFAFFEPLIAARTRRIVVLYVFISVSLAAFGIAFAYFVSLPAALKFLVNFGSAGGIESLITANEYFNFVLAYIAGFAVLFQLPLIITFINRVTPLTGGKLMSSTRYVVLGSFIIAAVITPTPDPFNQLLMAGPVILLYFLSACLVVMINRNARRRTRKLARVANVPLPQPRPAPIASFAAPVSVLQQAATTRRPVPPSRRVLTDMVLPSRNVTVPAYTPRRPVSLAPQYKTQALPRRPVRLINDFLPVSD